MAYRSTTFPGEIYLNIGTLDNPEDYPAQLLVFCSQKLPWLTVDENIPKYETLPEA